MSMATSQMFASQPGSMDELVGGEPQIQSSQLLENLTAAAAAATSTASAVSDNLNANSDISSISHTLCSNHSHPPCDLAAFLIQRACRNPTLANYLYWYLCIECESQDAVRKQDEQVKAMYEKVLKSFKRVLTMAGNADLKMTKTNLDKQQIFVDELVKLVKCVAKESGNRKKKTEKFQQLLTDHDAFRINFANFEPIPFPLDPNVLIKGIIPDKVMLFKSALMPSK